MKRTYFELPLDPKQMAALIAGLKSHFRFWGVKYTIARKSDLVMERSSMNRTLYYDESCEAYPHKLREAMTVDSLRWEQIGDYVNGFLTAIKTLS